MGRLTRAQKKGKQSSYTSRFLKKRVTLSAYPLDLEGYVVQKFFRMPKSKAVIMQLKKELDTRWYASPKAVIKGQLVNTLESNLTIKALKDFSVGQLVCNVERAPLKKGLIASAAGASLKIVEKTEKKVTLAIKERRIVLNSDLKAMKGQISCADILKKPLFKAGVASKIAYAKGKKYPKVSSSRMNVLDSKLGGSYKKKRGFPMTVSRNAPPGRKVGHIAAKRTGRKKR